MWMADSPVACIMSSIIFLILGSTFHRIEPNVKHEMQLSVPELARSGRVSEKSAQAKKVSS